MNPKGDRLKYWSTTRTGSKNVLSCFRKPSASGQHDGDDQTINSIFLCFREVSIKRTRGIQKRSRRPLLRCVHQEDDKRDYNVL